MCAIWGANFVDLLSELKTKILSGYSLMKSLGVVMRHGAGASEVCIQGGLHPRMEGTFIEKYCHKE